MIMIVHSKPKLYSFFGDYSLSPSLSLVKLAAETVNEQSGRLSFDQTSHEPPSYEKHKVSKKFRYKYVRSKIHVADALTG